LPVLNFQLADALRLSAQRLAELFGINLGEPAFHRRLADLHVPADLTNAQPLGPDYFNNLPLNARVEDSSL
jgi:hypothetical protein